jgi:hypothetical protein
LGISSSSNVSLVLRIFLPKGWFPVSGILRAGPAGGIFQADFAAGGLMAMQRSGHYTVMHCDYSN